MRAIILAGGKGTRLRPYTNIMPKPLVPVGDMPIIEIIVKQLINNGFNHITVAVNHLAHLISAFLKDGSQWGIKIDYSQEDSNKMLSTIGPLTLIEDLPENFLVMNGDILCDLNYKELFNHHISKNNEATVSIYQRSTKIDFGIIGYGENGIINNFIEKPVYDFNVSMGIYIVSRKVINQLNNGEPYGFDNLMIDGIKKGKRYGVKKFDGFWIDIGRTDDYEYCNENFQEIKDKINL